MMTENEQLRSSVKQQLRRSSAFGSRVGRPILDDATEAAAIPPKEYRRSLVPAAQKIHWFQLAFIAYSFTAAGPFGIEEAVKAVGPMWTFVGLFSIPVLYVIPQIIITSEMVGMMPSPHGASLWVQRAFGDHVGYFNSISFICTNLVETAIYPTLAADYIVGTFFPEAEVWHHRLICIGVIVIGTAAAMSSATAVGHMSAALSFLVMLPFFVGCGYGMGYWNWDKITDSDALFNNGDHQYGIAFSTVLWLFTGWRSLGALGEDVRHATDFLIGLPLALFLGLVSYALPLAVALSLPIPDDVEEPWDGGYIALAFDSALPGLGKVIGVAGAIGNIGLFATCMLCYPRMIWGAAERGWLPNFLTARWESTRTPWAAALVHVVFACVFIMFDFSVLMRIQTMIAVPAYMLGHFCLTKLRYSEPDADRPVHWPKSKLGSMVLVAVPTSMFVVVSGANLMEDWTLTAAALLVDAVIVASYYPVKRYHERRAVRTEAHDDENKSLLGE